MVQPAHKISAIEIGGVAYYSAADVWRELGLARQTLWRWRTEGKVPMGRRYRDGRVLFTAEEFAAIREYANHFEPVESQADQLKLFSSAARRSEPRR